MVEFDAAELGLHLHALLQGPLLFFIHEILILILILILIHLIVNSHGHCDTVVPLILKEKELTTRYSSPG